MIAPIFLLAAGASAHVSGLSALAPFVGSCWRADFTPTVRDTHCFETVYGGAHIRDRHEVRAEGKVVYSGETIYSDGGARLEFTYVNSMGGVGHGTFRSEPLRKIRFTGTMRGSPKDQPQAIDSEWRIVDPNHYEVRSLVKSKEGKPAKPLTFTRLSEPNPK